MTRSNLSAPGKLMLTGEYVVLDGVKALAVPTVRGQDMTVESSPSDVFSLHWIARDLHSKIWLECAYRDGKWELIQGVETDLVYLRSLLSYGLQRTEGQFQKCHHLVETRLDFPRDWGLGSSATLVANISRWLGIDPFELYRSSFSGSGYDLATCLESSPIIYQLKVVKESTEPKPYWQRVEFKPPFLDRLWFVHLGQKEDSQLAVSAWNKLIMGAATSCLREDFNAITEEITTCRELSEFEFLMRTHEKMLSSLLGRPRIKELYFADFPGEIKSLGAWGGDFILVTGKNDPMNYFTKKGLRHMYPYQEMIRK